MNARRAHIEIEGRAAALPALIAAVVLALLVAAPAEGKTRFRVSGAGWGHGVGLSAYGAYGFAKAGKDYRFILGH